MIYTKDDLLRDDADKDLKRIKKDIHLIAFYCKLKLAILAFILLCVVLFRIFVFLVPTLTFASILGI